MNVIDEAKLRNKIFNQKIIFLCELTNYLYFKIHLISIANKTIANKEVNTPLHLPERSVSRSKPIIIGIEKNNPKLINWYPVKYLFSIY